MSLIDNIIRPDVRALSAYHVQDAAGCIKLDAMENPYQLPAPLRAELGRRLADVAMNRYPTPTYAALKAAICDRLGVPAGYDVVLGNGSDELISMLSVACAQPGACVLAPVPTFVMYAMSARFAGLDFVGVDLQPDFSLDRDAMLAAIAEHKPAITYLAYPNNPTGSLFDEAAIVDILRAVGERGIVVVDEAYQPFANASFMPRLAEFDNLVVMRTVSKLGLAGIRLGYMSASAALLDEFEKVRPPCCAASAAGLPTCFPAWPASRYSRRQPIFCCCASTSLALTRARSTPAWRNRRCWSKMSVKCTLCCIIACVSRSAPRKKTSCSWMRSRPRSLPNLVLIHVHATHCGSRPQHQ